MALLSKFLIPKDFGYVILVGLGHGVLNAYLAYKVVKARKTYSIEVFLKYIFNIRVLFNNIFNSILPCIVQTTKSSTAFKGFIKTRLLEFFLFLTIIYKFIVIIFPIKIKFAAWSSSQLSFSHLFLVVFSTQYVK